MASGGFSFGGGSSGGTGGFGFGSTPTTTTSTATTGFSFGASSTPGTGGGIAPFGSTTKPQTIGIATPSTTSTPGAGFSLGGVTTATPGAGATTGFSLGGATTTTPGTTGFSLGGATTSTGATTGFSLGGATTTTGTTGFSLGGATTSAPATGFSLGGTTTATPGTTGFSLGGATTSTGATPSLASSTGFSLNSGAGKPSLNTGLTFGTSGLSLGSTTTSTGVSLSTPASTSSLSGFKLGGTTTSGGVGGGLLGTSTTSGSSIFTKPTTSTPSVGLGGVDPKTSTAATGGTTTGGKSSDVKALKETMIPDLLLHTVDNFQKYIKEEKSVREGIARMSSKPIVKVQEDTAALKQLLSVVSNTLQRNTCSVETLKRDMTQELKNSEMAQRTKDTPPGLQYENTAPIQYFQVLVDDFEKRMMTYRQQIEVLENHLASLHQPNKHSPAELIALLRKLHETFVALAAQLQQVHEAVKTQKEHFLNYRRIFHGDTKNMFERAVKGGGRAPVSRGGESVGPHPFTGITNTAAVAMASVLNRSQQTAGAPPVVGLGTGLNTTNVGFGLGSSTLGSSMLGSSTLGGGGGGLFGGSSVGSGTGGIFGTAAPSVGTGFTQPTPQSGATPGLGVGGFNMSSSTNQPFTLDKPPGPGGKRNKR